MLRTEAELTRRRNWSRKEALDVLRVYGIGRCNRYCLGLLTPEERLRSQRDLQLEERQHWEQDMFGRVITQIWSPTCTIPTKFLTS